MARVSLTDLLKPAEPAAAPEAAVGDLGPRYLRLERKEVRLATGQLDELTRITRRLNKSRAGRGERLTENTLIRIAVDLLLRDGGRLTGTTEAELRESVW